MPVVRISTGRFDPENYERVRQLLDESQKTLMPAIRALRGNRGYHVGIDRENSAISNVSIWDSHADALQMASLQPMLDLAKVFMEAGVRFDRPITNHETLWTL
jgi:quinol monooxygenase YgiN